ncbi:MAG TPA: hypothetical protein VHQ46_05860 [Desulfobacteria bacterium]|nr:hypothetical protein [Desulfobacteria bacterium]
MNIIVTLFKIFAAGTMAVYPRAGMYGGSILQFIQAGYRLGNHFGLFRPDSRPVAPGPSGQGNYVWWQDAMVMFKVLAPLAQRVVPK